jgi:hypothetical protein
LPLPSDVSLTIYVTNIIGDPINPTAVAFSPANGASGVAVNVVPAITWDVPVRLASGYIYLKKVSDDSVVDIWAATGATILSTPGHDPAGTVEIVGANDNGNASLPTSGTMLGATMRLWPNVLIAGGTQYYLVWDKEIVRNATNLFNLASASTSCWR